MVNLVRSFLLQHLLILFGWWYVLVTAINIVWVDRLCYARSISCCIHRIVTALPWYRFVCMNAVCIDDFVTFTFKKIIYFLSSLFQDQLDWMISRKASALSPLSLNFHQEVSSAQTILWHQELLAWDNGSDFSRRRRIGAVSLTRNGVRALADMGCNMTPIYLVVVVLTGRLLCANATQPSTSGPARVLLIQ